MKDFKIVKQELIAKLSKCTDNAKQEFAFLCGALIGVNNAELIIKSEISTKEYRILLNAVKKRLKGVPIQLLLGSSDFLGVEIIESKHTLKPRQETVLLVEKIIELESKDKSVLDLCSGSGCIGLALKKSGFNNVTLSDVSKKAIKMIKKNSVHNNLDVNIVHSNMFENIQEIFDIIVSNPPYIKSGDIQYLQKEVKKYDPILALDGGDDGLKFYRIIASQSSKYLSTNGVLYMEIGHNQENDVVKLLQNNFKNITIIKDYNNINRIIRAERC